MEYDKESFQKEIEDLLALGYEGPYWDYKSDYPDVNEDKLCNQCRWLYWRKHKIRNRICTTTLQESVLFGRTTIGNVVKCSLKEKSKIV